jgi:hypothetical protein
MKKEVSEEKQKKKLSPKIQALDKLGPKKHNQLQKA